MKQVVYTARAELTRSRQFLATALADLRASGPIAWRLLCSNLRVRHRRAVLGYLWLLLPAVGTALICSYIQARRIVSVPPTPLPYPMFVLSGVILWQCFVDAINAPLRQLASARQLITRSRVPHEAIILAGVMEIWINAAVRVSMLLLIMVSFLPFSPSMLLIPAGVASLILLGLAIGLALAPLGLLYDDVGRVIALATTFWFFLTPVVYPLPPRDILYLNPVAPLLITCRVWLGGGSHTAVGFFWVVGIASVALVFAWLWYRLARPHAISRLG